MRRRQTRSSRGQDRQPLRPSARPPGPDRRRRRRPPAGLRCPRSRCRRPTATTVDLAGAARPHRRLLLPPHRPPDQEPPAGWNEIPGARGCTPQSCAFRDHHAELTALGARVFGLSTQDTAYQQEAADRLHLPFPLLSDADLAFALACALPTFEVPAAPAKPSIKRLTLILRDGRIEHVFYPVFPPDADAGRVIAWLTTHAA